jgi:Mlo family
LLRICVSKKKENSYEKGEDYDARRLLAASKGSSCGEGKEPLWSSKLIHKVHILIFLIAISHVLYALLSLAISMLSMRRFHRFERTAQKGELLNLPIDQLQRQGESKIMFGIRQGVRQFTHPIDKATYVALRRLFFERMQVPHIPLPAPACRRAP